MPRAGRCPAPSPRAPYSPLDQAALGPQGSRAILGGRLSQGGRRGLGPPEIRVVGRLLSRVEGRAHAAGAGAEYGSRLDSPVGGCTPWSTAHARARRPAVRPLCVAPGRTSVTLPESFGAPLSPCLPSRGFGTSVEGSAGPGWEHCPECTHHWGLASSPRPCLLRRGTSRAYAFWEVPESFGLFQNFLWGPTWELRD